MKVPAECPGEQTKEEKKALKAQRQAAAAQAAEAPPTPVAQSNGSANTLTRQDTMNSLSSGYAATASRSVTGTVRSNHETVAELPASNTLSPSPSSATSAPRRNRIVAPPPAAYVGASNDDVSSPVSMKRRGRMVYAYEARDAGEVSIAEGKEFDILEPDGMYKTFFVYEQANIHKTMVGPKSRLASAKRAWYQQPISKRLRQYLYQLYGLVMSVRHPRIQTHLLRWLLRILPRNKDQQ